MPDDSIDSTLPVESIPSETTTVPSVVEQSAVGQSIVGQKESGVTVTDAEIAAAEKEIAELEYKAKLADAIQQHRLDPNQLAQSLKTAIEPLVPKPQITKVYDSEDMLKDFKSFRSALDTLIADRIAEFEQAKFKPFGDRFNQIEGLLPSLYLRSAENPNYQRVDAEAKRIANQYGIGYWQAAQLVQNELFKQQQVQQSVQQGIQTKSVPKHLSSPDTKGISKDIDLDKGPAEFGDIVRSLRTKYGNNI